MSVLGIIFLFACSNSDNNKKTEATKKISVEVLKVKRQQREELLKLLGTVEANRDMKIGFKIGGKIKSLAFKEGQNVKKGTLLAELDTTELLAKRTQALENNNKARRDLDRLKKLYSKHVVPLASFQDARSLFISAKAGLAIVEDKINNSTVRAPFSGRITKKLSEAGEIVSPGRLIAILAEIDPILVKAAVPDNLIQKVKKGQRAYVQVDSYPRERFKGVINRMETTAEPLSRTFKIEMRLANPAEKLKPGQIARVEVILRKKGLGIFIPLDSIIEFGSSPSVFVVKNLTAVGKDNVHSRTK